MGYPLQKYLEITGHREILAQNRLMKKKNKLKEAVELKHQREKELAEYIHWRFEEEKRQFEKLKKMASRINTLESYRMGIVELRDQENQHRDILEEAKNAVLDAEKEVEAAREKYIEANRQSIKMDAHQKVWIKEDNVHKERVREKEMEEFKGSGGYHI